MTTFQPNTHVQYQQPSDYEIDLNALPPPSTRTNAELNLSVLQRHLPSVTSILTIAPYAVIYAFSTESQSWGKQGIEGTLFVCRLSPALSPSLLGGQHGSRGEKERERERERYAIMVLNRQGLDNFVLELKSVGDVELAEEFVIVQDGPQVVGLWIFQEPEPASTAGKRAEVERIIRQCARRAEWTGGEEKDEMAGNGYGDSESDDAASAVVVVQTTHTTTQPISPSAQTRHSSSGHDILGELFRKASKNYHGS